MGQLSRRIHEAGWRARSAALRGLGAWSWDCPSCGFHGPFVSAGFGHRRPHARCPRCGAVERHRLQVVVLEELLASWTPPGPSALHFAPEPYIARRLRRAFPAYRTADIAGAGVDLRLDLRALDLPDASLDLLYASHVLEHVDDDRVAIAEICRVLRPGGVAILPVPVEVERTVEYGAPNPREFHHVRAPGPDYLDRYRAVFDRVVVKSSADYPPGHQLWLYEDRTRFPDADRPQRTPMRGGPHADFVPLCFRASR